jgi:hypothetical protein
MTESCGIAETDTSAMQKIIKNKKEVAILDIFDNICIFAG